MPRGRTRGPGQNPEPRRLCWGSGKHWGGWVGDGALALVPSGCSRSHPDAVLGSAGTRWPPRCLPTSATPRVFTSPRGTEASPLPKISAVGLGFVREHQGRSPMCWLGVGTCPGAGDGDGQGLVAVRLGGNAVLPCRTCSSRTPAPPSSSSGMSRAPQKRCQLASTNPRPSASSPRTSSVTSCKSPGLPLVRHPPPRTHQTLPPTPCPKSP